MTAASVVLLGVVCLQQLSTNLMPEVAYPTITVRTELPGSAPEEVEKLVTEPIEQRLGVLNNLVAIRSVSRAGSCDVQLDFRWGTRIGDLVAETREKLDQIGLPGEAKRPLILRYDPTLDPMMTLGVSPAMPAIVVRASGVADRGTGTVFATRLAARLAADALEPQPVGRPVRWPGGQVAEVRLLFPRGTDLARLVAPVKLAAEAVIAAWPPPTGFLSKTPALEGIAPAPEPRANLTALRRTAVEELQRKLEPLVGVAAAEIQGGLERELRVWLSEQKLSNYNLTVAAVAQRIRAENLNLAGGIVRDGQAQSQLRVLVEYGSLEEVRRTVVTVVDGTPVRLAELGTIEIADRAPEVSTRAGGASSVQVALFKEATANIVDVADLVRGAVTGEAGIAAELCDRVHVEVLADSSTFIKDATAEVYETAYIGCALAMLVLYLFLGSIAHTLVISIAIPVSIVATFAPMHLGGITLNVMSLGGLALATGMLVDNSIVVLESIHGALEEGLGASAAALVGTRRVAGAVAASTLTTVAVFFPIAFVDGIAGQIFRDQALTVVSGLMASLLVSVLLVPMLVALRLPVGREGYKFGRDWRRWPSWLALCHGIKGNARRWWRWPLMLYDVVRFALASVLDLVAKVLAAVSVLVLGVVGGALWLAATVFTFVLWVPRRATALVLDGVDRSYPAFVARMVDHPFLVLLPVVAGVAWAAAASRGLGSELVPEVRQGELLVRLELPIGTPLAKTDAVTATLEAKLLARRDLVASSFTRCGVERSATSDPGAGEHTALMRLRLVKEAVGPAGEAALERVIEELVGQVPELACEVRRPALLALKTPVVVEVRSADLAVLDTAARRVEAALAAVPGVVEVSTTLRPGSPELQLVYDRDRLATFGLDIRQVAEVVRDKVHGTTATRIGWEGERIDLVVALAKADTTGHAALERLRVDPGGAAVPKRLSEVARVVRQRGPSEIRHSGQQRVVAIDVKATGLDLGSITRAIERAIDPLDVELGGDVQIAVAGQSQEMQASLDGLAFALGLAMFLVYVVMACQFESVIQPLVIMLSAPLALVGVVAMLVVCGLPISVLVLIGAIVLAGIVVNNAIVLVDANNQLLLGKTMDHATVREAVAEGARSRLRPVLMTTLTTVLGLLPLTGVLGEQSGLELRRPLALTIIAGLSSSTLLTLVVIPVLYARVVLWWGGRSAVSEEASGQ